MNYRNILVSGMVVLLLSGCSALWGLGGGQAVRTGSSSSLVDYLYPRGEVPPEVSDSIPYLELPLRVGIAFVPGSHPGSAISEATRMQLLDNVKQGFLDRDYIQHIEIIPDTYLRSSKGIGGMQQVARLYGVDVMALVSYDQVTASADNAASLLYWTIVGAYFIKGTDNEVQTFVDTAVFDVDTARLLFRAPGTDKSSKHSTAVDTGEAIRKSRDASFTYAMAAMTESLALELDRFRERAMEDPTVAEVRWREGSGGGGSLAWLTLALLALAAACRYALIRGPTAASARTAWTRIATSAR